MIDERDWLQIVRTLKELDAQEQKFNETLEPLMIAPESPVRFALEKTAELAVAALETIAGDDFNSIGWFVYECDFGRKPKQAGFDGNLQLIDSYDKLRWLLDSEKT